MFEKNPNLLVNICAVHLRSVHGKTFPELGEIYTSLSKIRWSSASRRSPAGVEYRNRLTVSYPGLSSEQFDHLDQLAKDLFEVMVTTNTGERYQLAQVKNPMQAETRFNGGATEIIFSNTAIETIKYQGKQELSANDQFPYTLNLYLS